ncbi:MAG: hypothetical protein ACFFAO_21190 [Candidatus Hermodarchaeota archaeon]
MVKILIRCPACKKTGFINVGEESFKNVIRGLLAVNIESKTICEHSFIVYLDRNFKLRDYFIADFKINIPEVTPLSDKKEISVPSSEIIDLDLIKLNISAILLTYVVKSILFKKKIILILEDDFLYRHIINFFEYITQDTFEYDLSLISKEEYNNNKKNYKDYMVFEGSRIVNNVNNTIQPKKLKVEKKIVQNFLTESQLSTSLILLKNEFRKTYVLSKTIVDFIDSHTDEEKINATKILENLEKTHNIKVDRLYLNYLIEIVNNYFKIKIPIIYDSFLGFI